MWRRSCTSFLNQSKESEITAAIAARAQELLDYVGIGRFAAYKARTLSYGDQRRLEIARALATDPKLIALDEPAAGMNASEKVVLRELIDTIRKDGRTILLIEHDVKLVMGLCDRLTVLDYGKQIAEGTAAEVQKNEKVIEAYLGAGDKRAVGIPVRISFLIHRRIFFCGQHNRARIQAFHRRMRLHVGKKLIRLGAAAQLLQPGGKVFRINALLVGSEDKNIFDPAFRQPVASVFQ